MVLSGGGEEEASERPMVTQALQYASVAASSGDPSHTYQLAHLPNYLREVFEKLPFEHSGTVSIRTLAQIRHVSSSIPPTTHELQEQYAHLLLLRHHLTESMCRLSDSSKVRHGISPELILCRAQVYDALAYADLALADAYVAFSVAAGGEEDLQAVDPDGLPWDVEDEDEGEAEPQNDENENADQHDSAGGFSQAGPGSPANDSEDVEDARGLGKNVETVRLRIKRDAVSIVIRSLRRLGCTGEVQLWKDLLRGFEQDIESSGDTLSEDDGFDDWTIYENYILNSGFFEDTGRFGFSRREIYPWNEQEPDRMSEECLRDINTRLSKASDGYLEVRKTELPSVRDICDEENGTQDEESTSQLREDVPNTQLGLFALRDLLPNEIVLREHSVLTAIRPHDAPLCDACAADLESSTSTTPEAENGSAHGQRATFFCPGCKIPFCSTRCRNAALSTYHTPNSADSTTIAGYPPSDAPFCPGQSAYVDIHELGRPEGSETPEWDLYFLLITRCIMMAETMRKHPLEIEDVKWLWGGFNPAPPIRKASRPDLTLQLTLPFTYHHSITLPMTFFTTLLLSVPQTHPYSSHWLRNYDWWILQTLLAKFRGVADAKQSTWDGKAETAGVYGLWCLGNHSCAPNMEWETKQGQRVFLVRAKKINKGDEIWNHYTDVDEEDYRVRRGRLREVLGGDCMCERCIREERELIERVKKEKTIDEDRD